MQVSHFVIYQAEACSTDPLTILAAVQLVPSTKYKGFDDMR